MPFGIGASELIGLASIIIAAGVAYYYYKKGLQRKQLCYAINAETVIFRKRDHPSELRIIYADREIERLIRCAVYIWNTGNQPILRSDLETNRPLEIVISGAKTVLQSSIGAQSRPANNVSLVNLEPRFDYLNVGDGFVADMFLEAENTANVRLRLEGEVIGANRQPKNVKPIDNEDRLPILVFVSAVGLIGLIFFVQSIDLSQKGQTVVSIVMGTISSTVVLGTVCALALILFRKRIPRSLILGERVSDRRARWKLHLLGE